LKLFLIPLLEQTSGDNHGGKRWQQYSLEPHFPDIIQRIACQRVLKFPHRRLCIKLPKFARANCNLLQGCLHPAPDRKEVVSANPWKAVIDYSRDQDEHGPRSERFPSLSETDPARQWEQVRANDMFFPSDLNERKQGHED
jgi:hypothetical protein